MKPTSETALETSIEAVLHFMLATGNSYIGWAVFPCEAVAKSVAPR
jgi:hypothetical protein